MISLHHVRRGHGRPLLLVHGLGGSIRSWETIAGTLTAERELVIVDLPGLGGSPPLEGPPTVAALADALEGFLGEQGLEGVDVAGSSIGARLAFVNITSHNRSRRVPDAGAASCIARP